MDDRGDKLEIEVISFLNAKVGLIYYGLGDNGSVIGIENPDEVQQKIANRITNNIRPNTLGLIDVFTEQRNDKIIVCVNVSSGLDTPYYLVKFGCVPKGVYQRLGSTSRQITDEQICRIMRSHHLISLVDIPSNHQDLTFKQMQIYYAVKGIEFNRNYMKTLEFFIPDGKYNLLAYLFADVNNLSVRVGKW